MANKYKVIAVIGKAGSGKDTIVKEVLRNDFSNSFNKIITYTTRPPREGEIDGVNYHFISPEEFKRIQFIETANFNNWMYGTGIGSFKEDKINIGVFNPEGIYSLLKQDNVELFVFYIFADKKRRLLRQLYREESPDVDEIVRRYGTDEHDFSNITFEYISAVNNLASDITQIKDRILGQGNIMLNN